MQRIHEDPRVTKPYTEEQWQAIERLGHEIDEHLDAGDVRLTMGGEPTFVSIDDMDGDEWNTTALGDTKRQARRRVCSSGCEIASPGALLHYGQGKLYPGEPLPRWALGCFWRGDGVPIWENPDLIADEARDYGHTAADAQRFITALAERLGVDPACAQPAYEDVLYYLWREQQLPVNLDPRKNKLDDPVERHRLTQVFDRGLNEVVSYVLPLQGQQAQADAGRTRWVSDRWDLRRGNLFLLAGRLVGGLSPAAPLAALGRRRRTATRWSSSIRSHRGRRCRLVDPTGRGGSGSRRVAESPRRPGGPDAGELRDNWAGGPERHGRGPDRALRRAARRPAPRLPAARSGIWKIISTWSPPSRRRPRSWDCR